MEALFNFNSKCSQYQLGWSETENIVWCESILSENITEILIKSDFHDESEAETDDDIT